ncbi:hypothetical protein GCM10009751_02140 [Myceligenerans crystallogenes]
MRCRPRGARCSRSWGWTRPTDPGADPRPPISHRCRTVSITDVAGSAVTLVGRLFLVLVGACPRNQPWIMSAAVRRRAARPSQTSEDHMGSVIKKRRKRMAKKKHRKLLRKTRHQRRNKK